MKPQTKVNLTVKGDGVQVPGLVGWNFQAAALNLQQRGLRPLITEPVNKDQVGIVLSQDPAPQQVVARNCGHQAGGREIAIACAVR